MKHRLLQLFYPLIVGGLLSTGFVAGSLYNRTANYNSGYERAMEDVASGEVIVTSQATRAQLERHLDHAREVEYERVVSQVAEAYQKDPSEIEVECGLTDASGRILR